jgi:tryptophan synthase alpha chain
VTALLEKLSERRDAGRKLLVPYVMGGSPSPEAFPAALEAVAEFADAVEVGLPYSDPVMDGPVIAAAGQSAIEAGVGPLRALDLAASSGVEALRIAMTYYNPIHHLGETDFCARAADGGFCGLIVPDLSLEESESLRKAAAGAGLAWIPLVAPTSSPQRVAAIADVATGFIYATSTLGVTGLRESLSERAERVVAACREVSDLPVLVGIGISTPEQAADACRYADGVVIGSAVVRLLIERGAKAAKSLLEQVRAAFQGV